MSNYSPYSYSPPHQFIPQSTYSLQTSYDVHGNSLPILLQTHAYLLTDFNTHMARLTELSDQIAFFSAALAEAHHDSQVSPSSVPANHNKNWNNSKRGGGRGGRGRGGRGGQGSKASSYHRKGPGRHIHNLQFNIARAERELRQTQATLQALSNGLHKIDARIAAVQGPWWAGNGQGPPVYPSHGYDGSIQQAGFPAMLDWSAPVQDYRGSGYGSADITAIGPVRADVPAIAVNGVEAQAHLGLSRIDTSGARGYGRGKRYQQHSPEGYFSIPVGERGRKLKVEPIAEEVEGAETVSGEDQRKGQVGKEATTGQEQEKSKMVKHKERRMSI